MRPVALSETVFSEDTELAACDGHRLATVAYLMPC